VWLHPTKSTDVDGVISKLKIPTVTFGNPTRIIYDRGPAFSSKDFHNSCTSEHVQHISVTTDLPFRANGQVERLNSIIISVLAKLGVNNSSKWYTFVDDEGPMWNAPPSYH
jgi:hypothetical protein